MESLKGHWPIKFYLSLYNCDFVHNLTLTQMLGNKDIQIFKYHKLKGVMQGCTKWDFADYLTIQLADTDN